MTQFVKDRSKAVAQLGADNEIIVYGSITEAATTTGINISGICLSCQGKAKYAGGYKWKYASELTEAERASCSVHRETPESRRVMEIR